MSDVASKLVLGIASGTDSAPGSTLLADWLIVPPTAEPILLVGLGMVPGSGDTGGGGVAGTGVAALPGIYAPATAHLTASLSLKVTAAHSYIATEQVLSGAPSVSDYFVVGGLPYAHAALGVDARPVVNGVTMTSTTSWPAPIDVDLGADARFLPDSHLGATWTPTVGSGVMLHPAPTMPVLDSARGYLRGATWVDSPMALFGPDLAVSTADLSFSAVTVLLVAVLDTPDSDYYGLMGSGNADGGSHPDTAYVDLRYMPNGEVLTHSRLDLASFQSSTGIARAAQPVVLGFSLDSSVLTSVLCDRKVSFARNRLLSTHPSTATLYIGDVPGDDVAGANMSVLDLAVWRRALSNDELDAAIRKFDSIYGVTVL